MAAEIRVSIAASLGRTAPVGKREAAALLRRAARAALDAHGVRAGALSVTLLDDAGIATLNARYLGRPGPTDVIAFGLDGSPDAPVGDVYIGWEQALRQAAEHRAPIREELARLAVHGTLHVLGLDHAAGPERERGTMWRRQESIVREVVGS